ncbi:MAG: chorismate mutase, partial [Deinococcus sp.]|nr:chorismate mutase [Deinococcus sp.]
TFPAQAAREMGLTQVPLMCATEIPVPGALVRCVRVLLHVNTSKAQHELRHVYLRGAEQLRPDLAQAAPGQASVRPPPRYGTVAIVGVGLIGGSIGLGLRSKYLAREVVGLDVQQEIIDLAVRLGAIDRGYIAPGDWLGEAELVVLATPVGLIPEVGRRILPNLAPRALLTDVGSTKAPVVQALSDLPQGREFIGGHPMAGSEFAGVQAARASLLENAVYVLTPTPHTDPQALAKLRGFVTDLGAKPLELDPQQHDLLVASVSHLPYLISLGLMNLLGDSPDLELLQLLAAGGFRDITRIASGNPVMSRDMVVSNRAALKDALAAFKTRLAGLEELLDDGGELLTLGERAKQVRDSIPVVQRSLLATRYQLIVAVPDRPGQLARITGTLGDAGINIKEIEIVAIRELGGALRLGFESDEDLARARTLLEQAGYECRSTR